MASKIESGYLKGMPLLSPVGSLTRPTSSKVRSAVLDMLLTHWQGAEVLDVFAGTGGNGLAALSRGSASCHFVERDPQALQALQRNLAAARQRFSQLDEAPVATVLKRDAAVALAGLPTASFDVIWVDPPYAAADSLLPRLVTDLKRLLKPSGILILETGRDAWEFATWGLQVVRCKQYGKTWVHQVSVLE